MVGKVNEKRRDFAVLYRPFASNPKPGGLKARGFVVFILRALREIPEGATEWPHSGVERGGRHAACDVERVDA